MIHPSHPAPSCADPGPISAAISQNPGLHQACGGKMGAKLAKSCQEHQLDCTACHHTAAHYDHPPLQP